MARAYSSSKGVSGSKPVDANATTTWVKYSPAEIEKLIIKEAKEGLPPSKIGLKLRDTYGVPNTELLCQKTITEILKENNMTKKFPEDLMALFRKAVVCNDHLKKNKHDQTAVRGLVITKAKIHRLVTYYKKKDKVDQTFRFDVDEAKLLVE
ncbi:MAG: 30S ribosomal protein S15 [Candidatus Woesearchaeota archaeon]